MTLVSSTRSSNFFCLQFVAVKQQDVTLVVVVVVVASQMLPVTLDALAQYHLFLN
jgi:hypothetical protein